MLTLGEMASIYIVMQCCMNNCNVFNVVRNITIKEREIKWVGGEKTFNTNPTQSKEEQTNKQKTTKKKKHHNSGTFGEDGKHHVVAKVGITK